MVSEFLRTRGEAATVLLSSFPAVSLQSVRTNLYRYIKYTYVHVYIHK